MGLIEGGDTLNVGVKSNAAQVTEYQTDASVPSKFIGSYVIGVNPPPPASTSIIWVFENRGNNYCYVDEFSFELASFDVAGSPSSLNISMTQFTGTHTAALSVGYRATKKDNSYPTSATWNSDTNMTYPQAGVTYGEFQYAYRQSYNVAVNPQTSDFQIKNEWIIPPGNGLAILSLASNSVRGAFQWTERTS